MSNVESPKGNTERHPRIGTERHTDIQTDKQTNKPIANDNNHHDNKPVHKHHLQQAKPLPSGCSFNNFHSCLGLKKVSFSYMTEATMQKQEDVPRRNDKSNQTKRVAGTKPIATEDFQRTEKKSHVRLIHRRHKHQHHEHQSITTYMMLKWGTIVKPYHIPLSNEAKQVAGTQLIATQHFAR